MLEFLDEFLFSDLYVNVITVNDILYFPLEDICSLIGRSFVYCAVLSLFAYTFAHFIVDLFWRILDFIHDWRHERSST